MADDLVISKGWSKEYFFGDKILCKRCGELAEEDIWFAATSTSRRFRCKECKTEASFDETTQCSNPIKWKNYTDNFKQENK